MQRLFSTFANGWPGIALVLQRLLTTGILFYSATTHLDRTSSVTSIALRMAGAGAGVLLLIGLWTPVAGALVAALESWITLVFAANPLMHVMVATLGATLAMIGPGAWSIDARLFGRKHIRTPEADW